MGLSPTRIINVNISKVPTGLSDYAVNNVVLFTNDTPVATSYGTYGTYTDSLTVATDWGSSSLTTLMAENIFAQTPNILSGGGSLYIVPMLSAESATQGTFITTDISANIDDIIAVADGAFKVSINGATAVQYSNINFTNCTTLSDIAAVLQTVLYDVFVTVSDTNKLLFTSKKFGTTSAIAFSAPTGGTNLIGSAYLNTSAGTAVSGEASAGETIKEAIQRIQNEIFFVGILDTLNLEDSVRTVDATYVQSQDFIHAVGTATTEDIAGFATTISTANDTHTRVLLYSESIQSSKLFSAAYVGRGFSVNFTGSNTCHTMNLKSLANITPDSLFNLSSAVTIANACETAGVDYYVSFASVESIVSTGGNDYFDNIYNDIWFKYALLVGGFNYLAQTNTKVPQTEQGMDGLKGAYNAVCLQGVTNGALAPGTWNSSQTFGDPVTFKQNISQKGYYTYSLPITQQAQSQRNQRKAPLCQIAAKRAGAIHESDVIVIIEN